ncbi:MAG: 30S ribosome-binding factor RbfA [Desulfobacteraceae bacterium]|nr:30S ribosome-binding factor RbfA [Desulfobacteraceae bacterium]
MTAPRKTRYAAPELGRPASRRPARVAEAIREELAILFLHEVKDQRLAGVSIPRVEVTPDLGTAFVFFSCQDDELRSVEAGLASSRGFMRSHLAKLLNLRYMPELLFKRDLSAARQVEMERILREIADERSASERDNPDDSEG